MIRNQWYAVLDSKEIKKGKLLGVTRMGEKLVFWRNTDGAIGCLADKCAHRGVKLSCGKIISGSVQCPFHGFRYDTSGKGILIPANGRNAAVPRNFKVPSYPALDAHGLIWIFWGEAKKLPEIPWFDNLGSDFSYSTVADPWDAHYSRVIENQLDVVHLPFVHYNTIGRGNKTLVHGPLAELEGSAIRVWMRNAVDDGRTRPAKPSQIDKSSSPVYLYFIYPNIWQNVISDDLRVMIAFAPVDEAHTVAYLRFYQRFIKVPGLKQFVNWIGGRGNIRIAHQDRRVVETQQPKPSGLKIGENLIQGDNPIVLYRKYREKLQKKR
ncbi:Rieske 2Fe-2S domain-containing protein [candidate division WOR-3 bacterium]|uniref:Rieske 2Fe-2S domain-containing protein n=1 Tax=candidate division WOR-3 bacterium TaxID=2052148 RepID=A0A9D5K997_UNCW3|nr:Rieske 2Fe-2S domain-containing protein [candidate division WOR-3 bacterium]MBD3363919.1 Rieske 2Fe-2S domain-containing protein [candidate division WOR-3 bacterium]